MQKRVLIVVSKDKKVAFPLKDKIVLFLKENGIKSDVYVYDGFSYSLESREKYTHAITLGGDGTVLFTARFCAPHSIPVFPINFGRFGFIASIEPAEWKAELESFIKNEASLYERILLCAKIFRNAEVILNFEALNDIVASALNVGKLVSLDVSFNNISFGTYRGDGIICSTPTGSTAYSVASGGPILDPSVAAFLLVPMSPFSLSNRPIVLQASGEIKISTSATRAGSIAIIADGQKLLTLKRGDQVSITSSHNKAILAGCSPLQFYSALKTKLGWQWSAKLEN